MLSRAAKAGLPRGIASNAPGEAKGDRKASGACFCHIHGGEDEAGVRGRRWKIIVWGLKRGGGNGKAGDPASTLHHHLGWTAPNGKDYDV
jgi:hypothetical protein